MAANKTPVPIHESIVDDKGRATPALVRYLTQLANKILNVGIGVNQTWQNVAASRALGNTYTNDTGKPIYVSVSVKGVANGVNTATVGGVIVSRQYITTTVTATHFFIVPDNTTYSVTLSGATEIGWAELR